MTDLASWTLADFSDGGRTFPTYRKGTGPGVVIVHEILGKHSTLTEHRQQEGVDRVLDFLRRQLAEPGTGQPGPA
jgi:hypothetical protein